MTVSFNKSVSSSENLGYAYSFDECSPHHI
jgi:hypothetical protein